MSDQNETKSKVENKVNVRVALSWGLPWFAGTLFTIGFSPYPADLDLWGRIGHRFLYFIAWPLILGRKLAKLAAAHIEVVELLQELQRLTAKSPADSSHEPVP